MQLVLRKKHLWNERIYRKWMFAKSRIEIEILENSCDIGFSREI